MEIGNTLLLCELKRRLKSLLSMIPVSTRVIFAVLCAVGFVAICAGLVFELGRLRRGDSGLSARQLRWRLLSGSLWLLVLGSLFYATLFQWPVNKADVETARRFASIIVGSMGLLVIALILTAFDIYLTLTASQVQRARFELKANEMARREIERLRAEQEGAPDDR